MEKKRFLEGDNKRFCVVSRLLCFFCLFIGIYACQVDEDGVVNKGTLAFRMNVDTALVGVSTKASDLADFKDVNSYAVTIAQDSGVVAEYSRFDKMPAELELGAGAYTIQVSKGTETAAAFDAPYFSGKKEFTIVKDMTTPVEVTAAMANSRVTIDYSDDFLQTYKDYTLSLRRTRWNCLWCMKKSNPVRCIFCRMLPARSWKLRWNWSISMERLSIIWRQQLSSPSNGRS